jgi:hypothetical protein
MIVNWVKKLNYCTQKFQKKLTLNFLSHHRQIIAHILLLLLIEHSTSRLE